KPDLAVFANLRETSPDGPDLPEVSLDPATAKRPVLTATPALPMRYLVGGLAGLVVFCVLGYVVAHNLGDAPPRGEPVAGRNQVQPEETPDSRPPVKGVAATPEGSGLIAAPDLGPRQKDPQPPMEPYTPDKKPEEKKPEEKKPEVKQPEEKKPEEKKPEEK